MKSYVKVLTCYQEAVCFYELRCTIAFVADESQTRLNLLSRMHKVVNKIVSLRPVHEEKR